MFSTYSIKIFFALSALCFFSACGWRAAKSVDAPSAQNSAAGETISNVPFATKEPEIFSAEFVISTSGEAENKIFVARGDENRRRYDYNFGEKNQFAALQTSAGENFLIFPIEKIYSQSSVNSKIAAQPAAESSRDFLTNQWLNQKADAKFTRLGTENDLTRYAVRLDDSDGAETIVFFDERINLPVRQEFYRLRGEERTLTYAVEMKNFKPQADESLFEIPKDYKRVSPEILKTAMRNKNFSEE